MAGDKWTPDDAKKYLSNPIYCGIGSYQQIVPDASFIRAGSRLIKEIGPRKYLQLLLANLREAFGDPREDTLSSQEKN